MHVLLIHQAFVTPGEAGGTRHWELCRYLGSRGHRISVVASWVSYLTGRPSPDTGAPVAKAIEIHRVRTYAPRRQGFLYRVLGFVSFSLSSLLRALRIPDVDVVWGTTPPIFQSVTALAIARLQRRPFVLEVRDLWPEFAIEMGVLKNPLLIAMSRRLERFLYDRAQRVVVNSPGFIPHLIRLRVPVHKIDVIPNGVDITAFSDDTDGGAIRERWGLAGKFIALYAGAHGPANDLETVLSAAQHLRSHADIVLVCVGDGRDRPRLLQRIHQESISNVLLFPAEPKERMPEILAAADVCFALLKPIPMFTTTYPNKVFDYMAAGRPTVLAIDGVIREVIEAADAGVFVKPGDPAELAAAIIRYKEDVSLRQRHGDNARAYVREHFDRDKQARQLERVLQAACADAAATNR